MWFFHEALPLFRPNRMSFICFAESQGGYTAGNGGGSYPRRQNEEERIEMEILHEEPELQSSQQQQQQQLLTHATTGHHEQHDQQKDAPHITNCQDATIHLNKVNGSIAQVQTKTTYRLIAATRPWVHTMQHAWLTERKTRVPSLKI